MSELMVRCHYCCGDGHIDVDDETESSECGECDGIGYHATEDGLALLAFFKRFKP